MCLQSKYLTTEKISFAHEKGAEYVKWAKWDQFKFS